MERNCTVSRCKRSWVWVSFVCFVLVISGTARAQDGISADPDPNLQCPAPTFADVLYGPDKANKLDFWQASGDGRKPLIFFTHGGGFVAGDKDWIQGKRGARVRRCLNNGVSLVSINYRFLLKAGLLDILHDSSRALQFVRSKAGEWNIDKQRIAVFGESAGAGCSLWFGYQDEMADPANPDPVLRESTRVCAVGVLMPQATYDFPQWPKLLGVPDGLWTASSMAIAPSFYRMSPFAMNSKEALALRKKLDMLSMIDASDPPLYIRSTRPKTEPENWDHLLHHPRHATALKEKCDSVGVPCVLVDCDTAKDQAMDVYSFLFEKLGVKEKK